MSIIKHSCNSISIAKPGRQKKSISSSAFAANRQQILLGRARFPVLPQSGNICAVFGLVVALCEQLRETEWTKRKPFLFLFFEVRQITEEDYLRTWLKHFPGSSPYIPCLWSSWWLHLQNQLHSLHFLLLVPTTLNVRVDIIKLKPVLMISSPCL